MTLEPQQIEAVKKWLAEGASLSDVQKRLKDEFGVSMLYLDLRMLVLDIGAQVKDPPKPESPKAPDADTSSTDAPDDELTPPGPRVSITLDRVVKPGALASGDATFPNGDKIHWVLDRTGRAGIDHAPEDFNPSEDEINAFNHALRDTLMKNGYA